MVYQLKCHGCGNLYVGSTFRRLHTRFHEEITRENETIYKHIANNYTEYPTFSISIIDHDIDPINLRIREAIHIKQIKPTLNTKDELKELFAFINSLT